MRHMPDNPGINTRSAAVNRPRKTAAPPRRQRYSSALRTRSKSISLPTVFWSIARP